jgi:nucleotide-binding universal stress UspA family protein
MNKLLVALDGSPRADGTLSAAISMAQLMRAKLVLFRAVGMPTAVPENLWALSGDSLEDSLRKDAETYLARTAKGVPQEMLGGTLVSIGAPWQAICKAGRDQNVDLVVIGAHGYGGVDHLIGTTAAKVVNHCDRPVLVVRPVPKA